jgi:drug/metabolite transporter (DMT)-like permease
MPGVFSFNLPPSTFLIQPSTFNLPSVSSAMASTTSSASLALPIMLAIGAGLCWGIGEVCTKLVLKSGQVGPVTAVAVRTLVALPLVWLAWWAIGRVLGPEPDWTRASSGVLMKLIFGAGVAAGAVALILFYSSLKLADVSVVKPIAFTIAPATAVLLGWLILGETMTLRKGAAVALILTGVILLASPGAAKPAAPAGPSPTPPPTQP